MVCGKGETPLVSMTLQKAVSKACAVFYPELSVYGPEMIVYRVFADEKLFCDLGALETFGHKEGHFIFTSCKAASHQVINTIRSVLRRFKIDQEEWSFFSDSCEAQPD